jgi:hypothetical protein
MRKRKMQKHKNKTMATLITVILIVGMSIPLLAIEPASAALDSATAAAKAAGMKWDYNDIEDL